LQYRFADIPLRILGGGFIPIRFFDFDSDENGIKCHGKPPRWLMYRLSESDDTRFSIKVEPDDKVFFHLEGTGPELVV
jgi:hypothetical protein